MARESSDEGMLTCFLDSNGRSDKSHTQFLATFCAAGALLLLKVVSAAPSVSYECPSCDTNYHNRLCADTCDEKSCSSSNSRNIPAMLTWRRRHAVFLLRRGIARLLQSGSPAWPRHSSRRRPTSRRPSRPTISPRGWSKSQCCGRPLLGTNPSLRKLCHTPVHHGHRSTRPCWTELPTCAADAQRVLASRARSC